MLVLMEMGLVGACDSFKYGMSNLTFIQLKLVIERFHIYFFSSFFFYNRGRLSPLSRTNHPYRFRRAEQIHMGGAR